ncbi:hypothetical protein IT084_04330 [Desulfallas sp. Bu1-1]|uniref:putative PEP-binding protein n=1 Tax=Desulfallas sp. Bu1-1 TaxID=2787620 RepID=UPI0018A0BF4C|nr:putative PEP-binding protein [Desulfallas sp. Bu1-1]MBF7082202.1 hypothetical protein [Desulfallas sp. Bu1-1]
MNEPGTQTVDGHTILVNTFAYSMEEVEKAAGSDADGIGLLSTDFMYLNRNDLPGEEEQLETLLQINRKMNNRTVTVRTLQLPARCIPALRDAGLPDECRGVRLGLAHPEILETQLRALIRAGAEGSFRLMLPMVSDVSEILRVKEMINKIHSEFTEQNISFDSFIELGVEVETPAAVVMAPVLSFEISFFIVSEKLKGHTLATGDNGASNCNELLHDYTPSFLFQLESLAAEVRKRRKPVGVAAPLAGQPAAIPLLVALGVNELVVAPEQIEQARRIIARLTIPRAKLVASKAMSFWHPGEIRRYAEECLPRLLK